MDSFFSNERLQSIKIVIRVIRLATKKNIAPYHFQSFKETKGVLWPCYSHESPWLRNAATTESACCCSQTTFTQGKGMTPHGSKHGDSPVARKVDSRFTKNTNTTVFIIQQSTPYTWAFWHNQSLLILISSQVFLKEFLTLTTDSWMSPLHHLGWWISFFFQRFS